MPNRKTLLGWGAAVLVVAGVVLAQRYADDRFSPEQIRDWIHGYGKAGPAVFVVVYALAPLLFFPASLLTAAAGLIWGWKLAFMLVTIGANVCANLAFWIGRRLGQERVEQLTRGKFTKYQDRIAGAGFQTILLLRLIPLAPFYVLNYGAGVTRVRWRDYALGSLLGMIPGTFAYVYLGAHLDWRKPQLWVGLAGLLLLASLPSLLKWWQAREGKREFKKHWLAWVLLSGAFLSAAVGGVMVARGSEEKPSRSGAAEPAAKIVLPARIRTDLWDSLLKEIVAQNNMVRYADLESSPTGTRMLNDYIASLQFNDSSTTGTYSEEEQLAILINAYNALAISTILEHYPVESIRAIPGAFEESRHAVGKKTLSLDEIEQLALALGGYRVHAAVVCAARSCPPLRREAYVGSRVDSQLDEQMRQWLADSSLNEFGPNTIKVSSIFKWYADDFESAEGGLRGVLKKYAPPKASQPLNDPDQEIEFLPYDWGLNDVGGLGKNYDKADRLLDEVKKRL